MQDDKLLPTQAEDRVLKGWPRERRTCPEANRPSERPYSLFAAGESHVPLVGSTVRLPVTDADRDDFANVSDPRIMDEIRGGEWDDSEEVQARARYRLAHQPARADAQVEGLPLAEVLADADRLAAAVDEGRRTDASSIVDTLRRLAKHARTTGKQVFAINSGADIDLDPEIEKVMAKNLAALIGQPFIAVVETPYGWEVVQQTCSSVMPTVSYATKRGAASRVLQLLNTGPVAMQTWPETACIGEVDHAG
jgi:hypothetical protein